MENEIRKIVSQCAFEISFEDIDLDSPFSETSLDLLDQVELIMDIEKHYRIAIPDEVCEKFDCLNDIVKYLCLTLTDK